MKRIPERSRRAPLALLLGWTLLCAVPVMVAWRSMTSAQDQLRATQQSVSAMMADAERITALRAGHQVAETSPQPAQDLITRINDALEQAQLPQRHFGGVAPADHAFIAAGAAPRDPVAGDRYRHQSVQITLRQMEPAAFGRFLAAWRSRNTMWIPTRIELTHDRRTGGSGQPGNLYTAVLVVTAVYLADADADANDETPSTIREG